MTPPGTPPAREAPRVGEHRRGSRVRTTEAGTWFPAVAPDEAPAGLLLVHPGVDLRVLLPVLRTLAELALPGVLPTRAVLVEQAGRTWLVADAPIVPAVSDALVDGPHRDAGCAAAVLTDVGDTLLAAHRAGLVHGGVGAQAVVLGPAGAALLTDWGTLGHGAQASPADDAAGWADLAGLLAERWCPGSPDGAAELTAAGRAARAEGLDSGVDRLRATGAGAPRATLAAVAAARIADPRSPLAAVPPAPATPIGTSGPDTPSEPPAPPAPTAPPTLSTPPGASTPPAPAASTPAPSTPSTPSTPAPSAPSTPAPSAPSAPSTPAPSAPSMPTPAMPTPAPSAPSMPARSMPAPPSTPTGAPFAPAAATPAASAPAPPDAAPDPAPAPAGHRRSVAFIGSSAPQVFTDTATREGDAPGPAEPVTQPVPISAPIPAPPADRPGPPMYGHRPPADARGRRTDARVGVSRGYLIALIGLAAVAVLAIVADIGLLMARDGSADLDVRSVTMKAVARGPACTLEAVILTNGASGSVSFGWIGDGRDGAVRTEEIPEGQSELRVSSRWGASPGQPADPVVTLQVISPRIAEASVHPRSDCQ